MIATKSARQMLFLVTTLLSLGLFYGPSFFQRVVADTLGQGPHRDADGWTVFTASRGSGTCGGPSADYTGTCIYYVSSKGIDDLANCKGYVPPVTDSPPTTCASLAYAVLQTRTGKPD